MSTIKTKNIKQTVISGTTQPLKIGGILEDGSDAKISIGSDGTTTVVGTGQLIAEYVVSGSAVTSVNFNGLDINAHKSYRIEVEISNISSNETSLYLSINGNNTSNTYWTQFLRGISSSTSSNRANTNEVSYCWNNSITNISAKLSLINNRSSYVGLSNMQQTTADNIMAVYAVNGNSTISNITSITFYASSAIIGVGSKFRIYRG